MIVRPPAPRLSRLAIPPLLGLATAGAMPPFNLLPLLLVGFGGLVLLLDRKLSARAGFEIGFLWGLGFFVPSLYWVSESLFVDIAQFWWLLPVTFLGLPMFMSVFTGLAIAGTVTISPPGSLARLPALAGSWLLGEWLRGHVFTGFPWLFAGYAWSGDQEILLAGLQTASVLGIFGLSFLTVLISAAAASPWRSGTRIRRRAPLGTAAMVLAMMMIWGDLRLRAGRAVPPTDIVIRLVSTDLPERATWSPAAARADFERVVALAGSPGAARARIQLWPEGVVETAVNRNAGAREAIARLLPPDGVALVGGIHQEGDGAAFRDWNSLVAIDATGAVVGTYDKHHLVPLGEYVPLRWVLGVNQIAGGRYDFSVGPGPRTMLLPGLPAVAPIICYEAIFPGEIVEPGTRPAWIANITDDGWFGHSIGPEQHWAIARVRAVEQGLPLARSANGGITGMIGPYGNTAARLPFGTPGVVDVPLPAPLGHTFYSRLMD